MRLVEKIIEDVKKKQDAAVRFYTKKFDKINLDGFSVTKKEIKRAYDLVDEETIKALRFVKRNIELFAKRQMQQFKDFEVKKDGIVLGQKVIPIERIGVYIPGGNYPLPSTALMCIVTARISGVKEIIACSPKIKPETIVAADIAGADKIFRVGGAQAIAAMAYGTETIPKVDKIVGPGNIYVTAAKKAVYGDCGIDFLAGPSEIMIIADESADYRLVAIDLLAQLEHDVNSKAFLLTNSKKLIKKVKNEIDKQLKGLSTNLIIKKSIKNLVITLVKNIEDSIDIANKKSPEHLELQLRDPEKYTDKLKNYGSLFIGKFSAVVFGDYCSGTNHVLPTGGSAKYAGGLSVKDFVKLQTYQKINLKGAKKLGPTASKLSRIEGLSAHNKSVEMRLINNYIN
ncbi:histidinol dehydrogenase [Candidatus Woesearchaeota archaeon]|nr:histidinol dehydrogenase [Candidatus Woesearchaeota archaeon]